MEKGKFSHYHREREDSCFDQILKSGWLLFLIHLSNKYLLKVILPKTIVLIEMSSF
jgi:hypothetical protein